MGRRKKPQRDPNLITEYTDTPMIIKDDKLDLLTETPEDEEEEEEEKQEKSK